MRGAYPPHPQRVFFVCRLLGVDFFVYLCRRILTTIIDMANTNELKIVLRTIYAAVFCAESAIAADCKNENKELRLALRMLTAAASAVLYVIKSGSENEIEKEE